MMLTCEFSGFKKVKWKVRDCSRPFSVLRFFVLRIFGGSVFSALACRGLHSVDVGHRSRRLLRDPLWSDLLPTRFTMIVLTGTFTIIMSYRYRNVAYTVPTGSKGTEPQVSSLSPLRSLITVPSGMGSDIINYVLPFSWTVRYSC